MTAQLFFPFVPADHFREIARRASVFHMTGEERERAHVRECETCGASKLCRSVEKCWLCGSSKTREVEHYTMDERELGDR